MARRYGRYERNIPHLILKKNWPSKPILDPESLQKTFHTLSSLIPIGKVQVSKKLIIWLSIWHCSYHDNSKQTKWRNVVVVDVAGVCLFHYGYHFTEQNELALTGNLIFVFYIFSGSIKNVCVLTGNTSNMIG
jgi:hypothetical protein